MVATGTIPARQGRSRETALRIEAAARRLLQDKGWSEITMAELARAASAHVGSIYARFESKAALLDRLDEIYAQEVLVLTDRVLAETNAQDFAQGIASFVRGLAAYHRDNSGLVRTLVLETRTQDHDGFHGRSQKMNDGLSRIAAAFAAKARDENLAVKRRAIDWALFLILSLVREATLFPTGIPRPKVSDQRQDREITKMALSYLEV